MEMIIFMLPDTPPVIVFSLKDLNTLHEESNTWSHCLKQYNFKIEVLFAFMFL